MQAEIPRFRNLNRDGLWPGFHWQGLERSADGVLRLLALPCLEGGTPDAVRTQAAGRPAGIAVDREGSVYFSDPKHCRVLRVDGCSGAAADLPCVGGEGSAPTHFNHPTALLIPSHRHALYVADTGNGRIQIFDLDTFQLLGIWSGFGQPCALASDDAGNIFVVDAGTHRVERFNIAGDRVPDFGDRIAAGGQLKNPGPIAARDGKNYVLGGDRLYTFDLQGNLLATGTTGITNATGLAVDAGAIYIGDAGARRIAVFHVDPAGALVHAGDAVDYDGPVAALACASGGWLLVAPGGATPPLRLAARGSYATSGFLWSDGIAVDQEPHFWNGLHAANTLQPGAHMRFFVFAGAVPPPPVNPASTDPFPAPWNAVDVDVTDFFIGGERSVRVWVGAHFSNDLHTTPELAQLRLAFDQESYLPSLPAIYGDRGCGDFLLRFLSLFESFFQELEGDIAELPALLDPAAAASANLPWLAGFLALGLDENRSDSARRAAIAGAYGRYALRGTASGLRAALLADAGVHAVIDEPVRAAGWWAMPAPSGSCSAGAKGTWVDGYNSVLGLNTVLVSGEPEGAVVGTTAVLDHSELIGDADYGTTLFESVAHQFTVSVYRGEVACAGQLERVKAVLERERPAHTLYQLCIIDPGMRVGFRARLGIDTVIGAGNTPRRLGEAGLVLAGNPPGSLGVRSQVGLTTQL